MPIDPRTGKIVQEDTGFLDAIANVFQNTAGQVQRSVLDRGPSSISPLELQERSNLVAAANVTGEERAPGALLNLIPEFRGGTRGIAGDFASVLSGGDPEAISSAQDLASPLSTFARDVPNIRDRRAIEDRQLVSQLVQETALGTGVGALAISPNPALTIELGTISREVPLKPPVMQSPTAQGLMDDAIQEATANGDVLGAEALTQEAQRANQGMTIMNEIRHAPSVNQADDATFSIVRDQKLSAARNMMLDANVLEKTGQGGGLHRATQLRTIAEGLIQETYQASRIRKAQSFANTNIVTGADSASIVGKKMEELALSRSAGPVGQTKGSQTLGAFVDDQVSVFDDPTFGAVTENIERKTVINAGKFENPIHLEAVLTHENAHQRINQLTEAAATGDQTALDILQNMRETVGVQPWRAGDVMDDAIRAGVKSKAYNHVPPHGSSPSGQINEQMADLFVIRSMDPAGISPEAAKLMEPMWGKLNVQSRVPSERLDMLVPNPNIIKGAN